MADKGSLPLDADALAEVILSQCVRTEDGMLCKMLRQSLRNGDAVARDVASRPEVQIALALRISATEEEAHPDTALLLRTLRQVDPVAAAAVARECDVTALARSLSYVADYTTQQVMLLARLYGCDPQVGRRVFHRCGTLFKDFVAQSFFPYLDLPEELVSDAKYWQERGE